jgi:Zn-dependent protease
VHEEEEDRLKQPRPAKDQNGARKAGGALVGLAILAAKFKTILALLLSFKWLFLAPKLLLSFGSMFLSIWFYALLFGWKFGIVFVLLILVHELGHYVTFRNFGIPVSLPFFIPGLGAAVRAPLSPDPAKNAIAALAGPAFGVAASAVCWGYAITTGEQFWTACAYIGFFLNLFNLIPALPFDGGRIVGIIDNRLYLLGAALLLVWIVAFRHFSMFTLLILLFVLFTSVPRGIAAWRGQIDPREAAVPRRQRVGIAFSYLFLLALTAAGAAANVGSAGAAGMRFG